jgi:hypothetical protein
MLFREEESVWSLERLFGESFSSGDERNRSERNRKENVYREKDKAFEVPQRRNLHTLKNF